MRVLYVDNVLQLPEGGDFEALHCQPSTNFDRSTKLDLTTEPPLLDRCCCAFGVLFSSRFSLSFRSCFGFGSSFKSVGRALAGAAFKCAYNCFAITNTKIDYTIVSK